MKTIVEGTINHIPFRGILKPKKGDIVEITRVGDEVETRVPGELRKALQAVPCAFATWKDITPLARRDWIFWIITAKQKETRKRRVKQACENLAAGKRRVCCFSGIRWNESR